MCLRSRLHGKVVDEKFLLAFIAEIPEGLAATSHSYGLFTHIRQKIESISESMLPVVFRY